MDNISKTEEIVGYKIGDKYKITCDCGFDGDAEVVGVGYDLPCGTKIIYVYCPGKECGQSYEIEVR